MIKQATACSRCNMSVLKYTVYWLSRRCIRGGYVLLWNTQQTCMHQSCRRVSELGYPRSHPVRVHSQYRQLEVHLAEPLLCCAAVYPVVTGLALDAMRTGQPRVISSLVWTAATALAWLWDTLGDPHHSSNVTERGGVRWMMKVMVMAPCDRPYTTFYWPAIVNIALSCTVFDVK